MAKRLRKRTSKKARPSQAIEQDDDRGREHVNEKTALEQPEIRKESSVQASEPSREPQQEAVPQHGTTSQDTPIHESSDASKKRKRSRKRKRSNVPHPGPDPEGMEELSEPAKKAIAYTQQYLCDKDAWKFSKQRQNWLLRHMMWSPQLYEIGQELSGASQAHVEESMRPLVPPTLPLPDPGSWISDEHVSVVAAYLASIMGLAKQRMVESLQAAAQATAAPSLDMAPPAEGDQEVGETQEAASRISSLVASWQELRKVRASQFLEWIQALDQA